MFLIILYFFSYSGDYTNTGILEYDYFFYDNIVSKKVIDISPLFNFQKENLSYYGLNNKFSYKISKKIDISVFVPIGFNAKYTALKPYWKKEEIKKSFCLFDSYLFSNFYFLKQKKQKISIGLSTNLPTGSFPNDWVYLEDNFQHSKSFICKKWICKWKYCRGLYFNKRCFACSYTRDRDISRYKAYVISFSYGSSKGSSSC